MELIAINKRNGRPVSAARGARAEFSVTLPTLAVLLSLCLFCLPSRGYSKGALPRKYDIFELGVNRSQIRLGANSFSCSELSPVAAECVIMGYPNRDDFVVLKFYHDNLVSVAHFVSGADWNSTLRDTENKLGESSMPPYKSDKAMTYTWQGDKTYITLTFLTNLYYLVYEVRDIEGEPLFRKARGPG